MSGSEWFINRLTEIVSFLEISHRNYVVSALQMIEMSISFFLNCSSGFMLFFQFLLVSSSFCYRSHGICEIYCLWSTSLAVTKERNH